MNKEDLILQKLESMETEIKDTRSEIKDVRSEIKDVRSEIKDIHFELKDIREDASEMKVNQAKHEGSLHTMETKMNGEFQRLETKLDGLIESMRERKLDTNERWKIGGIIISCGVAVVSLILSILTRMGQ